MPNKKREELDKMYTYLIECRKDYTKIHNDSEESFDKVLLAVALPAVGWFLLFLDKMPPYNFFMVLLALLIILAWFSVIILNIYSFIWSKRNARKKIEEIDAEYLKYSDIVEKGGVNGIWKDEVFKEQKIVNILNNLAALFFSIGLFAMFIYIVFRLCEMVPYNALICLFSHF